MRLGQRLTLVGLFACATCWAQQMAVSTVMAGNEPEGPPILERAEMQARRGHGTIVVIVAAKDGYALAADSRLTWTNEKGQVLGTQDNAQKLFPIGKFTACVIAGNVASSAQGDGFTIQASVATEITAENDLEVGAGPSESMDAREFTTFFQQRLSVILELLNPDVNIPQNPIFAMSAVSFRPDGRRQWVSYKQNFDVKTDFAGRRYFDAGDVIPMPEPASKVVAIGAPSSIVDSLIGLDGPTETNLFTSTPIMRRYFGLKKSGQLDQLSLSEAALLAVGLVADTVKHAAETDGVGGPIDVATISIDGFRWIARKQNVMPLTPMYRVRNIDFFEEADAAPRLLDGFECIRCTFRNQTFIFKGIGGFRMVQPIFRDECKVTLDADAKRKMPQAVDQIRRVMGSSCKIVEVSVAPGGPADRSK